jgi:hypothetical protein
MPSRKEKVPGLLWRIIGIVQTRGYLLIKNKLRVILGSKKSASYIMQIFFSSKLSLIK